MAMLLIARNLRKRLLKNLSTLRTSLLQPLKTAKSSPKRRKRRRPEK